MIPSSTVAHYKQMQRLQALVVVAAADLWSEASLSDLTGSWAAQVPLLVPVLSGVQVKAAESGAAYGAATLAEQGLYEAPQHFVDSSAFGGFASDGRSLAGLLYAPIPHVKTLIAGGMNSSQALAQGGKFLATLTRTQVADAGRGAAGVDIAARPKVGYVRMLNPPSCSRCSVLAGKLYKWNAGFSRHPRCDCVHVASTESAINGGKSEGLIHDPYEYFQSLSESAQDKAYTKAGAQAIRDGGDIFQVVNSRRGMKPGGLVTTEGTTKRGAYGKGKAPRLTPEGIYSQNLSRAESLKLLEKNGYIFHGGQNPTGVIRGEVAGFSSKSTMTEAQKRVQTATLNWQAMNEGRNPFGRGSLTPSLKASIEDSYRKTLTTMGEIFPR